MYSWKKITWYGGSRMKESSPVIQRLLWISRNQMKESDGILLWCRLWDKKKFRPYVCLGRISYLDHDSTSHPIKFLFELKDYPKLVSPITAKIPSPFQQFIQKSCFKNS